MMEKSSMPARRDLTAFGSAIASRRGAYQQAMYIHTYGRKAGLDARAPHPPWCAASSEAEIQNATLC